MPRMTRMAGDIAAMGVQVEEIPGWETRGSSSFAPALVICHWTAGPRGSRTRPSLRVVLEGRPREGIPGPLCQVYLDRNGVAVMVAAGRANHAGRGSYRGVLGASGAYGIEAESAGNDDWTEAQQWAYPRVVAGLLRGLGRDESWTCGHSEFAKPTGRKIDIRDWPMDRMRWQVGQLLRPVPPPPPTPEFEEDPVIRFIESLYQHDLRRNPTPEDLAFWGDEFNRRKITTYADAMALFRGSRAEGGTVVAAYLRSLGREPKIHEVAGWSDAETIQQVFDGVHDSPEAKSRRGA